ncbi:hypothetical protein [Thalassoroseus pseudoceratinae]|uniref:hypothetical protein n=1 Tax=Thalassoroseus pseudoceratinae TaxID=2713176 RepID=UPI0014231EA0|nr:hypothetical protein [Thalassoroseus pseudoceratinae]
MKRTLLLGAGVAMLLGCVELMAPQQASANVGFRFSIGSSYGRGGYYGRGYGYRSYRYPSYSHPANRYRFRGGYRGYPGGYYYPRSYYRPGKHHHHHYHSPGHHHHHRGWR